MGCGRDKVGLDGVGIMRTYGIDHRPRFFCPPWGQDRSQCHLFRGVDVVTNQKWDPNAVVWAAQGRFGREQLREMVKIVCPPEFAVVRPWPSKFQ